MFKKIYKELILLFLIFGCVWGVSSYFSPEKIEPIDVSLSITTEEKIGSLMVDNVMLTNEKVEDSLVLEAVEIISSSLTRNIDSTIYSYTFHVLESPEINAFATFGGNIFIYSGLIKAMDKPDELSAVLAHEIGHVEEKHVSKMLVKQFGLSIIISILTGGDAAIITEILEYTLNMAFSRENETEADNFGLELLESSDINPINLANAFTRLKENSEESLFNLKGLDFISTHPNIDERITTSLNYRSEKIFPENSYETINWEEIKSRLD